MPGFTFSGILQHTRDSREKGDARPFERVNLLCHGACGKVTNIKDGDTARTPRMTLKKKSLSHLVMNQRATSNSVQGRLDKPETETTRVHRHAARTTADAARKSTQSGTNIENRSHLVTDGQRQNMEVTKYLPVVQHTCRSRRKIKSENNRYFHMTSVNQSISTHKKSRCDPTRRRTRTDWRQM